MPASGPRLTSVVDGPFEAATDAQVMANARETAIVRSSAAAENRGPLSGQGRAGAPGRPPKRSGPRRGRRGLPPASLAGVRRGGRRVRRTGLGAPPRPGSGAASPGSGTRPPPGNPRAGAIGSGATPSGCARPPSRSSSSTVRRPPPPPARCRAMSSALKHRSAGSRAGRPASARPCSVRGRSGDRCPGA